MLQLNQYSTGTICVGVPVDGAGNTMYANAHTPVLADFKINQSTALNAGGSLSSDSSGNIYWTYTAADTAGAGAMQVVCVNASYSMLPKELEIGALAANMFGMGWENMYPNGILISGTGTAADGTVMTMNPVWGLCNGCPVWSNNWTNPMALWVTSDAYLVLAKTLYSGLYPDTAAQVAVAIPSGSWVGPLLNNLYGITGSYTPLGSTTTTTATLSAAPPAGPTDASIQADVTAVFEALPPETPATGSRDALLAAAGLGGAGNASAFIGAFPASCLANAPTAPTYNITGIAPIGAITPLPLQLQQFMAGKLPIPVSTSMTGKSLTFVVTSALAKTTGLWTVTNANITVSSNGLTCTVAVASTNTQTAPPQGWYWYLIDETDHLRVGEGPLTLDPGPNS
jgi:hypothetical protein